MYRLRGFAPVDTAHVVLAGSEDWPVDGGDEVELCRHLRMLREIFPARVHVLHHGGRRGADKVASKYAAALGWRTSSHVDMASTNKLIDSAVAHLVMHPTTTNLATLEGGGDAFMTACLKQMIGDASEPITCMPIPIYCLSRESTTS